MSSVPWPTGVLGDMRDDSTKILFQSSLHKTLVSSSGMGRGVHSLMLSIQHFLYRTRHYPPSKVPRGIVLERLLWCVTCPNHANVSHWTVARKVPVDPQGSWSCSSPSCWCCAPSRRCGEVSLGTSLWKPESFFLFVQSQQAGSMFHSHTGGWRRQETCAIWTGLPSWWCCWTMR